MTLPRLRLTGIYSLLRDRTISAYFAANIASEELQLSPVENWDAIWGESTYFTLSADSPVAGQITEGRIGTDLWYPALIFALALLVAEMLAAWPRASERA